MTEVAEVKTIGDVERIVHGSGMWDGTGTVEFSNDGERWVEAWAPTEEHPHPEFARVQVHRKDVTIPKRKTIRWDDYVPRGDGERSIFWLAQWTASPSRHFDRITRMVNYREMFRDIIGDIVIEGEDVDHEPAPASEAPARDWLADFALARTVEEVAEVAASCHAAKAYTTSNNLDVARRNRVRQLENPGREFTGLAAEVVAEMDRIRADADAAWEPAPGPSDAAQGPATPERLDQLNEIVRTASGARRPTAAERGTPRDYLAPSGNRAARRKSQRKKGRR